MSTPVEHVPSHHFRGADRDRNGSGVLVKDCCAAPVAAEPIEPCAPAPAEAPRAWVHYARIARPDHWFKNVLMLPGTMVAIVLLPSFSATLHLLPWVGVGFAAACLAASANYVVNEYLDAQFDRHHPTKRTRPCAAGLIRGRYVLLEYGALASAGLGLAALVGLQFLLVTVGLLGMGLVYNVRPARTKDRPYLDVLSESVNNPLRFLLGWSVVLGNQLPPSSILITYWMGGAFLMGVKRYAEYRSIGDARVAGRYRRSLRFYSEKSLLLSSFFYALVSSFFLGIFLIKYRIEFLLTAPAFALLFTWYLEIGMRDQSPAQAPEGLFREWRFAAFTVALVVLVGALFYLDIPWLAWLLERNVYGAP